MTKSTTKQASGRPSSPSESAGKRVDGEIELLIRAKYPIIYVLTWEEERVARRLSGMVQTELGIAHVRFWSASRGFASDSGPREAEPNPIAALDAIVGDNRDGVHIFYDFHPFLAKEGIGRALFARKLRDLAIAFREHSNTRSLILVSPVLEIPEDLEKDVTIIDYPLPEVDEIAMILEQAIELKGSKSVLSAEEREKLLKAALGLTENEIRNVFSRAVVEKGQIEPAAIQSVLDEKEQIIRKSGILEYYPFTGEFDAIGGLEALKNWLRQRANSFSDRARNFGLPEPKGIMLVGVPGCGKSLSAKAVASEWKQPLLRLDIGKIFGGLVGASEENMRRSIKVAESVSPTILWLDEIEKGFAGIKSGGDAGVSARVFGTLLTWMQEKNKPVFVIATANDISKLPPELLRKGRFDEIFFVDLPDTAELKEIWRIHVEKRDRRLDDSELEILAKKSEGYTGAEIEQVVISSLYDAYNSGGEVDAKLLEKNLKETVPLSKTMEKEITALRGWAQKRARFASYRAGEVSVEPEKEQLHGARKLRTPYTFDNQTKVETLGEFRDQCKANEAEIWDAIAKKRLENWLRTNGLDKLAEETANIRSEQDGNPEIGFQTFVAVLDGSMKSQE